MWIRDPSEELDSIPTNVNSREHYPGTSVEWNPLKIKRSYDGEQ